MGKATRSAGYPQAMWALVGLPKDRFPVQLPFANERLARAWRFDFYAFRRALEREGDKRWEAVAALRLTLDTGGLVVEHVDQTGTNAELLQCILNATTRLPKGMTFEASADEGVEMLLRPHRIEPTQVEQKTTMSAVDEYLRGGAPKE